MRRAASPVVVSARDDAATAIADGNTPASPRRRRDSPIVLGLAALGLALGVLTAAARRLGDFDLPWHIATGRAFFSTPTTSIWPWTGSATVDDFSYTLRGTPLSIEWVGDGLLYLADRAAGPLGLQILAALSLGTLALLLTARARLVGGDRGAGVAFAALAFIVSGSWLVVRPALISFSLLAALLFLVDEHRGAAPGRARLARFALVIPLQLVWSATHGFAPLGALILVGYALYILACRVLAGRLGGLFPIGEGQGDGHADGALGWTVLVAALGAGATALGPHGAAIFTMPLRMRGYESYLTEWTPTTLGFVLRHDPALFALAFAALLAVVSGREGDSDGDDTRMPTACDLGLLGLAAVAGVTSVRLIPIAAIIAAPICARRLAWIFASARTAPFLVAAAGLLTVPALLLSPGTRPGLGWDPRNLPEAATRFIAAAHPAGPLFNFMPFGGYLSDRLYPDVRVFVDGRTGWLYPRDFATSALRAEHDPRTFAALDARYHFTWAVERAAPGERFGEPIAADPSFALVFLDETAAVYVRREGKNARLATEGYRALRHLTPPGEVLARALTGRRKNDLESAPAGGPLHAGAATDLDDLEHDARLAARQAPDSTRAHFLVAAVALARGDRAAFDAARSRIADLDAEYPGLSLLDRISAERAASPGLESGTPAH